MPLNRHVLLLLALSPLFSSSSGAFSFPLSSSSSFTIRENDLANLAFPNPSVPHLLVNISWDVSPVFLNNSPANLDTSIRLNSLQFGPGCRHTFSIPAVLFSGDDKKTKGWEAYTINLPLLNELFSGEQPNVVVSAQWNGRYISSGPVSVTATLFSEKAIVLQKSSTTVEISSFIGACAQSSKQALQLSILASPSFPSFALVQLSFNPYHGPLQSEGISQESRLVRKTAPGVKARIQFSESFASTELDSAVKLSAYKVGDNCKWEFSAPFISYAYGYFVSPGYVYTLRVQRAREAGTWQNRLVIRLFANWRKHRPFPSSRATVSVLLESEGGTNLFSQTADVFPDVGDRCPSYKVGELVVNYDDFSDSYSARLRTVPSPSVTPSVTARITFLWSFSSIDIRTALQFAGDNVGGDCKQQSSRFILYSGENFDTVGSESYIVEVQKARETGAWQNRTVVSLFANWGFQRPPAYSLSKVSVMLQSEGGVTLFSKVKDIFPDKGRGCTSDQVGKFVVEYDDFSNSYSASLKTNPPASRTPPPSVIARITFSWSSKNTDLHAAVHFAGSKVGGFCDRQTSDFVSFNGNAYEDIRLRSFVAQVQNAREEGIWQNRTAIRLFAEWTTKRPHAIRGNVSVVLESEDGVNLFSRIVDIFPDVGYDCPEYEVAKLVVEYDDTTDSYSAMLQSPTIDPFKPVRKGIKLQLTYEWNVTFTDLITAVLFPSFIGTGSDVIGTDCRPRDRYVFPSRNMKEKREKQILISLEVARSEGQWKSSIDIPLLAEWKTFYPNGGGVALLTAVLVDEEGAMISPKETIIIIPGLQVDSCFPYRRVATATVTYSLGSGEYSFDVLPDPLAASPSFFKPSRRPPRHEEVIWISLYFYENSFLTMEFDGLRVGENCVSNISPYVLYANWREDDYSDVRSSAYSIRKSIIFRVERAFLDRIWSNTTKIKFYISSKFPLATLTLRSVVVGIYGYLPRGPLESTSFSSSTHFGQCSTPQAELTVTHEGGRNFQAYFGERRRYARVGYGFGKTAH